MKIKELSITNFRGIESLQLNGFGDINIFTGKNNTGKSTCLEAIALISSAPNNFNDNFSNDVLEFITSKRSDDADTWKYLRKDENMPAIIHAKRIIYGQSTTSLETLAISDDLEDLDHLLENDERTLLFKKETLQMENTYGGSIIDRRNKEKEPPIKKRLYFVYRGFQDIFAELIESRFHSVEKVSTGNDDANYPGAIFINRFQNEETLHDILAKEGKLHKTIKRISEKIPDFEDLRNIDKTLFVFFKNKPSMPLSMMGDGFKIAILTTLYAQSLKNGTLILEEPENYLHPGLMLYMVDELILASKQQQIQLFLSTHNDELIRYFIERSKDLEVKIIQMSNPNKKTQAEFFDKNGALKEINELGFDLRGF